jgi:hypothetical protein
MEGNQNQNMTLEQIESHIQSANLDQFNQPQAGAADLSAQLRKICGVYKAVRPVFNAVVSFPLIPGSIKNAIKTFMTVLDPICP